MGSHVERVLQELEKFKILKENLKKQFQVSDLDEHGFSINQLTPNNQGSRNLTIDVLITGLIHGDEVVGLEAINRVLSKLAKGDFHTKLHIGFLLCNIPAAHKNVRYLETDLNRCFLIDKIKTWEERRAQEISPILAKAKYVLDMHQTVEPTQSPFFVFEHNIKIIKLAHYLDPNLPIATFPSLGFSYSGKTLLEYVTTKNNIAMTIEWGEKGFSESQSLHASNFILSAIQKLEGPPENSKVNISVYFMKEVVRNSPGAKLLTGLTNYMPIKKDQVLGHSDKGPIISPYEGRLFFPKYGKLANASPELCELGELVEIDL